MNVELLDYQTNALDILLYTKNTRLRQDVSLKDIEHWPYSQKLEHLDYMRKTIQSSFEFVRYIFNITGVSRNFTHQLVRTRKAAYAQESQRTVDVRDADILGLDALPNLKDFGMQAKERYAYSVDKGVPVQEARNILPTGIETSITMAVDLRELMHMGEVRLCTRTQGEYQEVFKKMREAVLNVHPWLTGFIEVYCVKYGTCCFPNYTECPIQKHTIKVEDDYRDFIKEKWEETDHVANPVAMNGRTM